MKKYSKEDPSSIQAMFGSIAKHYDKANAILSLQLHKNWNAKLIRALAKTNGTSLLDLCAGTGDIALMWLKGSHQRRTAYLLDFCGEMLECAKQKAKLYELDQHDISYLQGDAQNIPLKNCSVSCVSIAYGIRNVKDPINCIQETFRVLQPGGMFGILELTQPRNPILRFGHSLYLKAILPFIGRWMTSNEQAYQYLCGSIHSFISASELEKILIKSGFQKTKCIPLFGGIATMITGFKPQ